VFGHAAAVVTVHPAGLPNPDTVNCPPDSVVSTPVAVSRATTTKSVALSILKGTLYGVTVELFPVNATFETELSTDIEGVFTVFP
jgi:hypothetical protein